MAQLNSTCPKCTMLVSEQDHKDRNVEPAIRLTGPVDPTTIHMQGHWQHTRCP
jgi:hypothetical protein